MIDSVFWTVCDREQPQTRRNKTMDNESNFVIFKLISGETI